MNHQYNSITAHFIVSALGSRFDKGLTGTLDELVDYLQSLDSFGDRERLKSFVKEFLGHLITAGQVKIVKDRYHKGANWKCL